MSEDVRRFEWAQPQTGDRTGVGHPAGRDAARGTPKGETPASGGSDARKPKSVWRSRAHPPATDATNRRDEVGCANGCTHGIDRADGRTRTDGWERGETRTLALQAHHRGRSRLVETDGSATHREQ